MPLPNERNKTYDDSTPLDPEDMNDLQDQIIALESERVDTRWVQVPLFHGVELFSSNATKSVDYVENDGTTAATLFWALPVREGDVITQARMYLFDSPGSGSITLTVSRGAAETISNSALGSVAALTDGAFYTIDLSDHVVEAGYRYFASISFPDTGTSQVSDLAIEVKQS